MGDSKIALLSGRLKGTKNLKNELEAIQNPDEYENFLIEYSKLKINISDNNEVIYINDNQDFEEHFTDIQNSEYISLYANTGFNRLYVAIDNKKVYAIRINKIDSELLSKLLSSEKPIKFSLNSFPFIKWCNNKEIDVRNIFDIFTFIKILTNNLDINKTIEDYVLEYTDKELLEDDKERSCIIVGNFIYEFGKYLYKYIIKFDDMSICKMINENSYLESIKAFSKEESKLIFSFSNLEAKLKSFMDESVKESKERLYVKSPLGRFAIKIFNKEEDLLKELFLEDIEILILNEFYTNNLPINIINENLYEINCKFKNVNDVFSLVNAILTEISYRMFDEKIDIKIECNI